MDEENSKRKSFIYKTYQNGKVNIKKYIQIDLECYCLLIIKIFIIHIKWHVVLTLMRHTTFLNCAV